MEFYIACIVITEFYISNLRFFMLHNNKITKFRAYFTTTFLWYSFSRLLMITV